MEPPLIEQRRQNQDLRATETYAAQRWGRVGQRIRSITPSGLARFLLVAGALALLIHLIWDSRISLAPFIAGLILAYISAPIVNWFEHIMPRWLAVLLVVVGEFVLLVALAVTIAPPLASQLANVIGNLPRGERLRAALTDLLVYLRTLPAPTQDFIRDAVRRGLESVGDNVTIYMQGLLNVIVTSVFSLLSTFGFILSFLVVPTWLVAVLTDQKIGAKTLDRIMPAWMRPDAHAVARIVDQPMRAFVNGQFLLAIAVGLFTYAGLYALEWLGWLSIDFKLLLALLAGLCQLIPVVGATLSTIAAGLLGLSISPATAGALIAFSIGVQFLVNQLIFPQLERRYTSGIAPAILAVAVVLISQFGVFWLLLAGPLTLIIVNLFRYVYGRIGDPPRPAGLLPDESLPTVAAPVRRQRFALRRTTSSPELPQPVTE